MTRNEQVELGKKIQLLIEKKVGSSFSSKFQGGGRVAILKIAGSDTKYIQKIRDYISKGLGLSLLNGSKNHGSGMKNTILINLSEIDSTGIQNINTLFKRFCNNLPKKKEFIQKEIDNDIPKIGEEEKNISKLVLFKKIISPFLRSAINFELKFIDGPESNKKIFVFEKKNEEDDYVTIRCITEEIGIKAEMSLYWFLGDPSFVVRDSKDLLINFSEYDFKKSVKKNFVLPPQINASLDEVEKRLLRVRPGIKSKIKILKGLGFEISYIRGDFVPKIFSEISSMNWPVEMKDEHSFIVDCSLKQPKELVVEKEIEVAVPFVSPNKETDNDAKKQALEEIKALFNNKEIFSKLEKQTQEEITDILKDIWKKEDPNRYAKYLLSILKIS